jgi:swainsonine biosynthesis oxidoreductase SwnR
MSDYSEDSVLSVLDSANITALISFVNCPNDRYSDIHCAFLNACIKSRGCKRLIPSEWAGNVDDYPLLPSFYATSREPFRRILKESNKVEWTLFNGGWLMDYFLSQDKTYMPPIPDEFPVDPNNWRACIRGTGDEMQAWTCAREIGKAVVELLAATEWVRKG